MCGKKFTFQSNGPEFSPIAWYLGPVSSSLAVCRPQPCKWI